MAKTNHNPLLTGVRGRIGDLVIKQYKEGTVITMMPNYVKRKPTRRQQAHRVMFAAAVKYGKAAQNKYLIKYGNDGRADSRLIYFASLKAYIAAGRVAFFSGEVLNPKQIPQFEVIKGRVQAVPEKQAAITPTPDPSRKKIVKKVKAAVKIAAKKKKK